MRSSPFHLMLAMAVALGIRAPAGARPVTDCPLRDAPYSIQTPLIDVLVNRAAKAVVEGEIAGVLGRLPPMMSSTTAPSFAAILTLRELIGMGGQAKDKTDAALARLDPALRAIPVTAADRVARCARYDNDRPEFAPPTGRPRLLLFEKINGFKDTPSVNAAHAAFVAMAQRHGWAIVTTDKGGAINPVTLRQFDTLIWNNISGDVLTLSERAALRRWIEHGGGFVGVHGSAGDPVYFWDWYVDDLIGARFEGHPFPQQFQDARVVLADPAHPITQGLPPEWHMTEEWYSFSTNPRSRAADILATLDESTYEPLFMARQNLQMGDHPIAWTRCIGAGSVKGRMFYSAIGHRPEMYSDPTYVRMLEQAVAWASDRHAEQCR